MPPQGEEDVPTKVVSTTAGEETAPPPNEPSPPPGPSKVAVSGGVSKWVIVGVASAVVVSVGLGVGLGVGLTRKNEREAAAAAAAAEAEARAQSLVDVASETGDSATTTIATTDPTVVATDPATVTTSSSSSASSGTNDGTTPTATTTGSTSSASSSAAFDCDPSEDPEESCREVSNYCGGCHCLALHKDEVDDYNPLECPGTQSAVQCFVDPCQVETRQLVCNSDTRKCDWGKPSSGGTTSVPGGESTKETPEATAGVDDDGFLSLGTGDLSESRIYSSSDASSSTETGGDGTAVVVNDGLLPWQFRSFSADVLDGYGSCDDLRVDLLNAANFLIDRVIERNAKQEYYHMPMPAAGGMDDAAAAAPEAEESSAMDSSASKESDGGRGQNEGGETDYGTNNQVDDVDEVDVIKSDGDYVYAAYDDRIYVWEVGTGKIVSETVMSQPEWEEPDWEDCKRYPHPVEPEPFPVVDEEVDEIVDVEVEVIGRDEGGAGEDGQDEERIDDQPPPPSLGAASSPSVSVSSAATSSMSTENAAPEKKSMIIDPCYRPYRPRVTVRGLLLPEKSNRLVAFVQGYEGGYPWYPHPWMTGQRDDVEDLRPILSGYGTTHVKVYDTSATQDVTNEDGKVVRTELVQVSEAELPGQYQNGRSIGTRIHAVTTSNVDTYYHLERHFSRWNNEFQGKSKEDYRKEARKMAGDVAEKFVDRLLEEIKVHHGDDDGGSESACEDIVKLSIFQTGELDPLSHDWWSGRGVLGGLSEVTSFDISEDPAVKDDDGLGVLQAKTATAFVPNSWSTNLYVRGDVLLLATTGYDSHPKLEYVQSTFIYAYRLPGREDAGGAVTTAAKAIGVGKVPGTMINQYSMDLWEDHLRVATTVPARWGCVDKEGKEIDDEPWDWEWSRGCRWERVWGPHNAITVLKVPPRGEPPIAAGGGNEKKWRGLLEETGRTPHLGKPGESITAVRYDEERAYVVTFERIDPFIIVNLTDPTFPNATGELEIPGWSNYLHPVPYTDTVLAVGQHADNVTGRALGLKISLFDTDWYRPDLLASEMAEKALDDDEEEGWQWSSSDVQWDAKAFRYLVQSRVAVLPARINRWTNSKDYREQFCFDGFYFFDVNTEEGNESIRRRFKYDMAEKDKNQYGCYGGGYLPARSMVFDGNAMLFKGDRVHSVNLNSEKRLWNMKLGGSKLPN